MTICNTDKQQEENHMNNSFSYKSDNNVSEPNRPILELAMVKLFILGEDAGLLLSRYIPRARSRRVPKPEWVLQKLRNIVEEAVEECASTNMDGIHFLKAMLYDLQQVSKPGPYTPKPQTTNGPLACSGGSEESTLISTKETL